MENKSLKFNPNLPTEVELAFDEPYSGEGKYGIWYLYGVKPLISGETGFFATEILNGILQDMKVKTGSKLIITKVVKDEKTNWDVKRIGDDQPKEVSIDDIPEVINEVDTTMTLEQKVDVLWTKHLKDKLPF